MPVPDGAQAEGAAMKTGERPARRLSPGERQVWAAAFALELKHGSSARAVAAAWDAVTSLWWSRAHCGEGGKVRAALDEMIGDDT